MEAPEGVAGERGLPPLVREEGDGEEGEVEEEKEERMEKSPDGPRARSSAVFPS